MLVTFIISMIHSFKHRGLKRLYENGDRSRINPLQIDKIELILADLDAAETILHLRRPGYRLHELKGRLAGRYAIDVSGNWRIVFRFQAGWAYELDLMVLPLNEGTTTHGYEKPTSPGQAHKVYLPAANGAYRHSCCKGAGGKPASTQQPDQ